MKTCNDCGVEYPYLQRAHILAKHKGGANDPSNIVLICPNCHYLRDHDERIEFLKKAWTPERRKKHSDRMKGRTWSTNPDKNMAAAMRAKANTNTPEAQASRKESMEKRWQEGVFGEERNAKVSQSMKGNKNGIGNKGPKGRIIPSDERQRRGESIKKAHAMKSPEEIEAWKQKISATKQARLASK